MEQTKLLNALRELSTVNHVRNAGRNDLYIYTDGRHDRSVPRTLFSHHYLIVDISANTPSSKGNCYIYAMHRDDAEVYLRKSV